MSAAALVVAACAIAYRAGLVGPPVLDDLAQLGPLLEFAPLAPRDWAEFIWSSSGPLGRPVAMLSFLLDSWIFGADLVAWKATNLVLHLVAGALAFGLARALLLAGAPTLAPAGAFGLAVASVWLLHPQQVSTVLYTVQRMTELSALFTFAGLWCYTAGRHRQREGGAGGGLVVAAFLVFLPLAALSKENGLLLPLLMLLVELVLFRGSGSERVRRRLRIAFATTVALPLLVALGVLAFGQRLALVGAASADALDVWSRLLTQGRVLWVYAAQTLLPRLGGLGFHHDDVLPSTGLLDPAVTLLALVAWAGAFAGAWSLRRSAPLVSLGLALFLGGHAMESSVLPLELMFEHRNYLPSFGLLLAAGAALAQFGRPRLLAPLVAVAMVIGCGLLTAVHASHWRSTDALAAFAARTHPESPRVLAEAANRAERHGRFDDALALLSASRAAGARAQSAYLLCRRDGALAPAVLDQIEAALAAPVDSYFASGLMALAGLAVDGGCALDRARLRTVLAAAERGALRDASNRAKLAIWRAHLARSMADAAGAHQALADAERTGPGSPIPALLAAIWAAEDGDASAARERFAHAATIAPPESRRFRAAFDEAAAVLAAQ